MKTISKDRTAGQLLLNVRVFDDKIKSTVFNRQTAEAKKQGVSTFLLHGHFFNLIFADGFAVSPFCINFMPQHREQQDRCLKMATTNKINVWQRKIRRNNRHNSPFRRSALCERKPEDWRLARAT